MMGVSTTARVCDKLPSEPCPGLELTKLVGELNDPIDNGPQYSQLLVLEG